jgi:hypothetical protein
MKYDLFYVSTGTIEEQDWKNFKSRFPSAQKIENATSIADVKKKSFTKLFWLVWSDLVIRQDFDFSYEATKWDLEYVHVFKNGNHFNGICLFPKTTTITSKEFKYRFFINKKEIDIVASDPKIISSNFDIIFISYNEPNADENWHNLKSRFPRAQRISGIKGIHQAHIEAAKQVNTEMFWVVDGDAKIIDTFNFDYEDPEKHTVHVWQSLNPINGLVYGYGGVKLLPTQMTIDMDVSKPDMTTSISNLFKPVERISNITAFNTDPFSTWRSAFRECCKLASRVIDRQNEDETRNRLNTWCSVGNEYATDGARAGKEYGEQNKTNIEALKKINDFEWLKEQFNERHRKN